MAKATVTKKAMEITLVLTEDEARTLQSVTGKIGGSPFSSPRRHFASIKEALAPHIGYYGDQPEYDLLGSGSLYFGDY